MTITIQSLAADLGRAFEGRYRPDSSCFRALKDGSPEWMTDCIHAAHGDRMPDDWIYAAVERVADAIGETDEDADLDDEAHEAIDGMVDVYTSALCDWLASSVTRPGYCDEAAEELGRPDSIVQAMQWGQFAEYREIWAAVVEFLTEQVEA
ncbi:hypothetical protein IWC96_14490 [Brevundimonas sp. BAL450]|uniref:hypothetical protein n=1 Tax=Brevundimonas sp. BAL450 TaxID=1708162 RepID=UPI0018CB8A2A|nr:hypothetical protein [Brevundimonas sp. BAL450]MBG7616483.1 hypothetical protein [Brevundimonas sp. BAL450]